MKEIKVPVTTYKTKYETSDGLQFDDRDSALLHEAKKSGRAKDCPRCLGKGQINFRPYISYQPGYGREETTTSDRCPDCNGKGYLELVWR